MKISRVFAEITEFEFNDKERLKVFKILKKGSYCIRWSGPKPLGGGKYSGKSFLISAERKVDANEILKAKT